MLGTCAPVLLTRRRAVGALGVALLEGALSQPTLRVALIDVPPFGSRRADGRLVGLFVDCLAALSQRSGLLLEPILLPYRRASRAPETGETDLALVLKNRWVRSDLQDLGTVTRLRIVALPRAGLRLRNSSDLKGLAVASLRGLADELDRSDVSAGREQLAARPAQLVGLLLAGRVDVAVGVAETLDHAAREAGLGESHRQSTLLLSEQPVHLYARADLAPHQTEALRAAVAVSPLAAAATETTPLAPAHRAGDTAHASGRAG